CYGQDVVVLEPTPLLAAMAITAHERALLAVSLGDLPTHIGRDVTLPGARSARGRAVSRGPRKTAAQGTVAPCRSLACAQVMGLLVLEPVVPSVRGRLRRRTEPLRAPSKMTLSFWGSPSAPARRPAARSCGRPPAGSAPRSTPGSLVSSCAKLPAAARRH